MKEVDILAVINQIITRLYGIPFIDESDNNTICPKGQYISGFVDSMNPQPNDCPPSASIIVVVRASRDTDDFSAMDRLSQIIINSTEDNTDKILQLNNMVLDGWGEIINAPTEVNGQIQRSAYTKMMLRAELKINPSQCEINHIDLSFCDDKECN